MNLTWHSINEGSLEIPPTVSSKEKYICKGAGNECLGKDRTNPSYHYTNIRTLTRGFSGQRKQRVISERGVGCIARPDE